MRGWDPKKKTEVVGRAKTGNGSPQIGIPQPGADVAKGAWGEAKYAVVDKFVRSPAEAEKVAQATLDKLAASFVEAEGTCDGNAKIKGGTQVKVEGVGNRFNGTYYVTQAVHHWTKDGGLKTHFTISGRRDRSLLSMLGNTQRDAAPVMAFIIGIVTNNKDPEEMGRVRVKFPSLSADDESAWARIVSPMAGDGRGFFYIPEVDDEVLVGFENGDIHRPFILGALWNGKDKTPINATEAVGADGKVNKRVLKSRSGHIITLDDSAGGEEISIVDKTGNNKIILHSPDNSMQIKVDGDFTLEAKGKITLKSIQGVDMQSQADFKVSGQTGVDISTTAQLKLSGTAAMDINSTGPMTVMGTPIKLN